MHLDNTTKAGKSQSPKINFIGCPAKSKTAIEIPRKNRIIIGSPGSGKTRRLTDIFAGLVSDGAPHDEITAVAFNVAVGDQMRERISADTDIPQSHLRTVSTLHALCLRLLREEMEIQAMDPRETAQAFKKYLSNTSNYKSDRHDESMLQLLISLYEHYLDVGYRENLWLYCLQHIQDNLHQYPRWINIRDARQLFQRTDFHQSYESFCVWRMHQNPQYLTFRELLLQVRESMGRFANRFRYLLIDETQDLSGLMLDIVLGFNAIKVLVGDPDQGIYSYVNRSPYSFLSLPFEKEVMPLTYRFDTAHMKSLERGLRQLIKGRSPKVVEGKGRRINVYPFIPERIDSGAVLGRTNRDVWIFSRELARNLCPHEFERFNFLRKKKHRPLKKEFHEIALLLECESLTHFAHKAGEFIDKITFKEKSTHERIQVLRKMYGSDQELLDRVFQASLPQRLGLCLRSSRFRTQAQKVSRVPDLEQFLKDLKHPRVFLSTTHRYKGLENENVYIPHFDNGLFPLRRGDFEQEVRVCFVALSRTKGNLYVQGDSPFWSSFLARR